jgi:RimJ/RimL family protein N-acetyltransferase
MKDNATVVLRGERVRLVPYLKAHIQQYHAWMQDEELLRLTCSEPLSLEEESSNQRSWRDDPHKVTFIVCALGADGAAANDPDMTVGMCGDVNAFLAPAEEEEEDDEGDHYHEQQQSIAHGGGDSGGDSGGGGVSGGGVSGGGDSGAAAAAAGGPTAIKLFAELEIMIAEPGRRRGGLARESLLLFVHWLLQAVPRIATLVVKITDDNEPSRRLFESLGFAVHKHMPVFGQTEYRLPVDDARRAAERHWDEVRAEQRERLDLLDL